VQKAEQEQLPTEPEDAQEVIRRQAKEIRELGTPLDIVTSATAFFGKAKFDHRHGWGIEPICQALKYHLGISISPLTYYAHKNRPPSARAQRDAVLKEQIMTIHTHPRKKVYGIRKIHAELNRTGYPVARSTVKRLCQHLGVRGTVRGKFPRMTKPVAETGRPADLVKRDFSADAPNELWVADLMYERHSDRGIQGGFKWSSQHLEPGGVWWDKRMCRDWKASGCAAAVGGGSGVARTDAFTGAT